MNYEIDLASGTKSDEVVATMTVNDVPAGTSESALRNHYQRHVELFMSHIRNPRVIALRRMPAESIETKPPDDEDQNDDQ